ncbi:response regulator [Methyloferula stellata]|uniref:response regulator n=1 Tax=Methyloferula stellata TaxID=876270 RepID=UPI00037BE539|nr:response regulator [Methyloferula stellata]
MIVEDDGLQRFFLTDMLEDQGMRVLQAANALEAIKQIETHPEIQLLFTDIQLAGEIDGLDLLRIVHLRWPHVSLLTTSGRLHPHYAELPSEARFISKPVQEGEMLKEMNALLTNLTYPSGW